MVEVMDVITEETLMELSKVQRMEHGKNVDLWMGTMSLGRYGRQRIYAIRMDGCMEEEGEEEDVWKNNR